MRKRGPAGAFIMVEPARVAEVGLAAAYLYARIAWRSQRGGWRASRAVLAEETGLSAKVIRTSLAVLRERGWIASERASGNDASLVWSTSDHVALRAQPCGPEGHLPDVALSAISSLETVETNYKTPAAAASEPNDIEVPVIPEPLPPSEQLSLIPMAVPPAAEQAPPQTAQTLVARWCDGYRSANAGADAPGPVMKRVAGQARNMAKGCATDADWGAAWRAAYAAGQHGRPDAVPFLVTVRSMYPQTGRVNHDLANLMGTGPVGVSSPVTETALAMIAGPTRQRPE